LSKLQRYVLARAGRQRRVYYADVLEGYFGWKPVRPIRRYKAGDEVGHPVSRPVPAEDIGMIWGPGRQYFSRRRIGEKAYHKTMVTLGRACLRLGQRGLVRCLRGKVSHWAGVEITDLGREWLSVNSGAKLPQS
jgi:hypothetical protein